MSEYLSKEEIKQWRSSLEKITLEEFAARLGKKVEQKKETNDLVDIVLHGKPVVSDETDWSSSRVERLSAIADRAYEKEKELYVSPFSAKNLTSGNVKKEKEQKKSKTAAVSNKKETVKPAAPAKETKHSKTSAKKTVKSTAIAEKLADVKTGDTLRDEVRVVFKKSLTDREQKVFDYFKQNRNEVVYAKDLANLLELPRDYIYKYIKNLRAKIDGDALKNADKGGFILTV